LLKVQPWKLGIEPLTFQITAS